MADYKKDADKLFPWEDEEDRKKKSERGDSIPPNTSISSKLHSKPKNAGQEYLDMYIMSIVEQMKRQERRLLELLRFSIDAGKIWQEV